MCVFLSLAYFVKKISDAINYDSIEHYCIPLGAEVTGELRVNGKLRHLRCCTLEDQLLALKIKHRVHNYVNTAATGKFIMT